MFHIVCCFKSYFSLLHPGNYCECLHYIRMLQEHADHYLCSSSQQIFSVTVLCRSLLTKVPVKTRTCVMVKILVQKRDTQGHKIKTLKIYFSFNFLFKVDTSHVKSKIVQNFFLTSDFCCLAAVWSVLPQVCIIYKKDHISSMLRNTSVSEGGRHPSP